MTATRKPAGRSLADFQALDQPLKPAEQKLLEACRLGTVANISPERPKEATDNNTVRAAFLRFLALGGDEQAPVHEHGVQLIGAWIEGELGMWAAKVPSNLTIGACRFDTTPVFRGAKIAGSLNLGSTQLPGLKGDGLACEGNLFLHPNFIATGEVRLPGAQIGGDLDCSGAKFDGKGGAALMADSAAIQGSVFLNEATSAGEMRLPGARIGVNLACGGARFDGKNGDALMADNVVIMGNVFLNEGFIATGGVRLPSAQIGGNFVCGGAKFDGNEGDALVVDGMVVEGTFFFRHFESPVNGVSLAASHVGRLVDEKNSWGEWLVLDGFVYDSIAGGAPCDAATRLAWLEKQRPEHSGLNGGGANFRPQPWRQLAKVLREMGHAEDARQVSIAFEHRLRKANLIGQTPQEWSKPRSWLYRKTSRGGHWLFWVFTGYGYRPLRLLGWMFGVWLVCAMFYWYAAAEKGVFAPSNPLVFQNPNYAVCAPGYVAPTTPSASAASPAIQGAGNWYLCEKLPEEYSGFSPLAYSLDVILPLVDLQQETSWSPLIPTPKAAWYQELFSIFDWKHFTRLVLWFEILFGWVSSLLLVAVVSGLTKRREE